MQTAQRGGMGGAWGPLPTENHGIPGDRSGLGVSIERWGEQVRLSDQIISYIESLRLNQGRYAGKRFRLHGWQQRFVKGAWGCEGDAGLSLARGGGKTTFTAALAAATLDGPLQAPMSETLVVASSFDQGKICFAYVLNFLRPVIESDPKGWRVQDNSNRSIIENRKTGSILRVLASDPRRMHGRAPKLILMDEVAQWPETTIEKAIAALETSRGKIPDSKSIWLGTRAATSEHVFEKALDNGLEYVQIHCARADDPVFQRRTWKRANPGIDLLPDLEKVIRQEAERAKKDPGKLMSFRALRLNQGVSDVQEALILSVELWLEIESKEIDRSGKYLLGLDLGQNSSMSACAGYWMDTGALDCFAVFPETPSLYERQQSDGVGQLYTTAFNRSELILRGERVSDIPALLREVLDRWGAPAAVVCDSWRIAELKQAMGRVRFPRVKVIERRQGFGDGGEDLRNYRTACIDRQVKPGENLLLRAAMAGARVQGDAAGNVKLKKVSKGRVVFKDDCAAASIIVVAEGYRRRLAGEAKRARGGVRYAVA